MTDNDCIALKSGKVRKLLCEQINFSSIKHLQSSVGSSENLFFDKSVIKKIPSKVTLIPEVLVVSLSTGQKI